MALVILGALSLIYLVLILIAQSVFALFNLEEWKTSTHTQEVNLTLKVVKKLTKAETKPASFLALTNVFTAAAFFVWPKDHSFAFKLSDEGVIAVAESVFNKVTEGEEVRVKKITTRSFYNLKWHQRPWLINFFLGPEYKRSKNYQESVVKYHLV